MPWSDVNWTINDTPLESKFDQMVENLEILFYSALAKTLVVMPQEKTSNEMPGMTHYRFQVQVGSHSVSGAQYSNTTYQWGSIDSVSLSGGALGTETLHQVSITPIGYDGAQYVSLGTRKLGHIVGGSGFNKFSVFYNAKRSGNYCVYRFVSIVAHMKNF